MPKICKVQISFVIEQQGDYFVAYCPSLDLSAYAHTASAAKKSFAEVLKIFIEDTTEKGTLEKVLLGLGWKLQQKPAFNYQPPRIPLSKRGKIERRSVQFPCYAN
jgi:hypothetical protein